MAEERSGRASGQGDESLVTEEELRQLPRWAKVAFAARCAQRVRPLFRRLWSETTESQARAVDRAIALATISAADPTRASGSPLLSARATAAHIARAACAGAAEVAEVAATAAACAVNAIDAVDSLDAETSAAFAAAASTGAAEAAAFAANADAYVASLRAMRRDFDFLREVAKEQGWTDDSPVPAEFLGPLWPEGEPEGWPRGAEPVAVEFAHDTPSLSLYFDASDFDSEAIATVILGLSELYRELADDDLVIDDITLLTHAAIPEGVC